ncbi:unnamed protein product, partial [Ceratitis capitata]
MDIPGEEFRKLSLKKIFKVKRSSMASEIEWKIKDNSLVNPEIEAKNLNNDSNNDIKKQTDIEVVAHIDKGMPTIASSNVISKNIGPIVPPKPFRKNGDSPQ